MIQEIDFYYHDKPQLTLKIAPSSLYILEALKIPIDEEQIHHAYKFIDFKWLIEDLIVEYCEPLSDAEITSFGGREEIQSQAPQYARKKGRSTGRSRFMLFSREKVEQGYEFLTGDIYSYEQPLELGINEAKIPKKQLGLLMAFQLRHTDHLMVEDQLKEMEVQLGEKKFERFIELVLREYSGVLDKYKIESISEARESISIKKKPVTQLSANKSVQLFYILLKSHDAWPTDSNNILKKDIAHLISRVTNISEKNIEGRMREFLAITDRNHSDFDAVGKFIQRLNSQTLTELSNKETKDSKPMRGG